MVNNKNDILIKQDSKEEESYCKKYGIELHKLDNGITIVGMSCGMDFTNWARIYYEFSEGAYGNPAGLVHLLEHFFNKKVRSLAERNSLKINAQTSTIETREIVSGIANPQILDYGIWVALDGIRESLESPIKNLVDTKKEIETEKQIIKSEIQGRITNHNYHVNNNFCNIMYDPKNPFFDISSITGNEEELDRITEKHLDDIQEKILIPKNLVISVYTEGDTLILKKLIDILKKQYITFPRISNLKHEPTIKLQSKLNLKLKAGDLYRFDTKIKNGMITNQFNWIFKHKFGSKKYFSLKYLKNILSSELFNYSRINGWGYLTEVCIARPTDDTAILNLRVDVKKDNNKNLDSGITEILSSIKTITKNAVELEHKRQLATPFNVQDRFDWIAHGIKMYGEIIDADRIRNGMLSVTSNDLNNMLDEIISIQPVVIVTGDLE